MINGPIPHTWLDPCEMRAIVVHWTAGSHKASSLDCEHYHIMIENDGRLIRGDHAIADNVNTADDDYAAHTRAFNTKCIGVGLCGMLNARERPFDPGRYPLQPKQFEMLARVLAQLSTFYRIPLTRDRVLTHAEVQPTLKIRQNGKWDIARIPHVPALQGAIPCGDWIRKEAGMAQAQKPKT